MSTSLDGFHVALTIKADRLDGLEKALSALETLGAVSLFTSAGESTVVALLGFDSASNATVHQPQMKRLAAEIDGQLFDLGSIDSAARGQLVTLLDGLGEQASSRAGAAAAFAELKRKTEGPLLRVEYSDFESLFAAWAQVVAEGALWIPTQRPATSDRYRLVFFVGEKVFEGTTGRVLSQKSPKAPAAGFWLETTPSAELKELLAKRSRERHAGRPAHEPPAGVVRRDRRYETMLEVRFDDMPALAAQWAADISHGGMFICCPSPPDLRAKVDVHIRLPSGQENLGRGRGGASDPLRGSNRASAFSFSIGARRSSLRWSRSWRTTGAASRECWWSTTRPSGGRRWPERWGRWAARCGWPPTARRGSSS